MAKKYFPRLRLRGDSYENVDRDFRERKIIIGGLDVQYWKTYMKSKVEKELLKCAKAQAKDEMNKYLHNKDIRGLT